jgi:hypothetical protein
MTRVVIAVQILLLLTWVPSLHAAKITLEKDDQGITVKCDGQPFARYHKKSGAKPILWPIYGPGGQQLTRGYPMRDALPTEKQDHIHHRSFWFDHGDVNGVSFWHESGDNGTIEHREYLKIQQGDQGVIQTSNQWVTPGGEVLCDDVRTMTFAADDKVRHIDFLVKVTAAQDQVVFGDTKEGSFGLRVAGTMRVDAKQGGTIVNSEGQRDGAAWGKRASWVDYSGPVDGQTVGIAILNHPLSLRYPTYWHVRTYGLFAANPFGLHDFLKSGNAQGALKLDKGESFEMFYRVILHNGDAETAQIAKRFKQYASESVGQ